LQTMVNRGCAAPSPAFGTGAEGQTRDVGPDMTRERGIPWAALAILPMIAAFGCGGGATKALSTDLGSGSPAIVELGVGQRAVVDGVEIHFVGVTEDSRCAVDVVCVWAGNGAVLLHLSSDGEPVEAATVNTILEPRSVEWHGLALKIAALEPEPLSTVTIDPGRYRVELEVSRTVAR